MKCFETIIPNYITILLISEIFFFDVANFTICIDGGRLNIFKRKASSLNLS